MFGYAVKLNRNFTLPRFLGHWIYLRVWSPSSYVLVFGNEFQARLRTEKLIPIII